MYPNQQYPRPGGGAGAPYPQQSPYNAAGAHPQQQPPFNNPSSYGVGAGLTGGYQQNMSSPYGSNQGQPGSTGNPYTQGSNPQGGNPYNQPGYGMSAGGTGPGGYPSSGQSPYGGQPYAQNTGAPGTGYPPSQSGAYPPQGGAYPPQGGAYPPQGGAYPPQSGGYPPQGGAYPPQSGGYPPQSGGYPPQSGGYPPQTGGYPGQQPSRQPQGAYPEVPQGGGFGGPGMGPNTGGFMANDPRAQRLNQVIQQYEIDKQFAARLQALGNCEIVVLCDDSGSMNTPIQGSNQTRWDELKSIVNLVVDISSIMDSSGVDVYFLNRDPVLNVTNPQSMRHVFNTPPQGLTPLTPALRRILAAKRSQTFEKKLLILIATDGAPTNEHGQTDIGTLEAVLRHERTPQTYITFLACTDDLEAVNYLSNWDKSMPNLDVMDDYRSEKAEIQRARGGNFPFSFGDYIVKSLLGSIDPWFDSLDERA